MEPSMWTKRKVILAPERIAIFSQSYKDSREEFYEHNIPTSLYNIFEELLSGIPKEHLEMCETEELFKSALESFIKKRKTYI